LANSSTVTPGPAAPGFPHLDADETAADHDGGRRLAHGLPDPARVRESSAPRRSGQIDAGNGRRIDVPGSHDLTRRNALPDFTRLQIARLDCFPLAIDGNHFGLRAHLDVEAVRKRPGVATRSFSSSADHIPDVVRKPQFAKDTYGPGR